jgi:hypothetical protein
MCGEKGSMFFHVPLFIFLVFCSLCKVRTRVRFFLVCYRSFKFFGLGGGGLVVYMVLIKIMGARAHSTCLIL